MPLVQESLDLLFDKRCLIMGFSTKPVSVATLQSTFLCRSADPSLDVLKDGLYDLFWLVKSHVISQRGNVKARITTRTCHQSRARDLYPQWEGERESKREILTRSPCFSLAFLSRNTHISPCTLHLNFNDCLKLSSEIHTNSKFSAQLSKKMAILQEKWHINCEFVCQSGFSPCALTFPRREQSEFISPGSLYEAV